MGLLQTVALPKELPAPHHTSEPTLGFLPAHGCHSGGDRVRTSSRMGHRPIRRKERGERERWGKREEEEGKEVPAILFFLFSSLLELIYPFILSFIHFLLYQAQDQALWKSHASCFSFAFPFGDAPPPS